MMLWKEMDHSYSIERSAALYTRANVIAVLHRTQWNDTILEVLKLNIGRGQVMYDIISVQTV